MLFKNFAATTLAFAFPLSATALSFTRPEALVLNEQHTTSSFEGWSWVNCGGPNDAIQLNSINVSPDPPKVGQDLTVTVQGSVSKTIDEGAYADVVVRLGLVRILARQFDICEEARSANVEVQCPISPGDYTVSHTVTLPKDIPPAKFVVQVRGYTVDDEDLLCVDLTADFMRKPRQLGYD